jgi:hypothetical protein
MTTVGDVCFAELPSVHCVVMPLANPEFGDRHIYNGGEMTLLETLAIITKMSKMSKNENIHNSVLSVHST